MTSQTYTVTRHRCDRCDSTLTCSSNLDDWKAEYNRWGVVTTQRFGGGVVAGTHNGYRADLCDNCMDGFESWLSRRMDT